VTTQLERGTEATPEAMERAAWQPRIVAMVCNWCTYSGADMAGTARRTYAPNARIVRFLCTGRMDPVFILRAFQNGADGVLVSGCHPGDCHYVHGNMLARRRFTVFGAMMDFLGLDRRRLHFAWVSASEGVKWSRIVDEVTEAVREVGPLGDWTAPSIAASAPPFGLPEPGAEPRGVPASDVNESITAHLRETAARLLAEGEVSVVAGYAPGSLPGRTVPAFVTRPEDASTLIWNEHCANNLAVYLPDLVKRRGEGKVGLVVKSCDARALVGLLRENQLAREDVVLLGVPCAGLWEDGRLAYKCYGCADEVSPLSDWTITPQGAREGPVTSSAERAVADDPRDAQIAALAALSPEARWSYWQRQFDRCLRCYACRAVCPMCYCATCVVEKRRPQWVPATFDGAGNTAWNITRAMHLAGRCVGCDECARVCPADIRLDLLNRRVAEEIESRFDYRSDEDPSAPAPLTTFRPDDPDEFA
jgi:coenzyme F420-reducing hydrogenase delta subunit/ferredoxin